MLCQPKSINLLHFISVLEGGTSAERYYSNAVADERMTSSENTMQQFISTIQNVSIFRSVAGVHAWHASPLQESGI